jgi:hypothetical protein
MPAPCDRRCKVQQKKHTVIAVWAALAMLGLTAIVIIGACGPNPECTRIVEVTEVLEVTDVVEVTEVIQVTEVIEVIEAVEEDTEESPPPLETPSLTPWPESGCNPESEQKAHLTDEITHEWEPIPQGGSIATRDGLTYVRDEVIIMGPRALVHAAVIEKIDTLDEAELQGGTIYELAVQDMIPQGFFEALPPDWPPELYTDIIIGLYMTGSEDALDVVVEIDRWATDMRATVFAEPNRLIGHPHSVAGSPHSVAGSPYDLIVDGVGVPGAFWEQWALGQGAGIGLIDSSLPEQDRRQIPDTGDGVEVAIFDSSPFTQSGIYPIEWITPELGLHVTHVLVEATEPISPADHGLFASGLAHAVAPESEIHLYKVLNNELTGNIGTLVYGVIHYANQRLRESNDGTLNRTVMNFSLGVVPDSTGAPCRIPDNEHYEHWALATFGDESPWAGQVPLQEMCPLALSNVLSWAHARGAALVAAAGNDAENPWTRAEEPASYRFVLGVEASGFTGGRTCYTKLGNVAAPGGDPGKSQSRVTSCPGRTDAGCAHGIVSLSLLGSPCTGYMCWVGTSFAAPLVSGEVAAMLGHCTKPIPADQLYNAVGATGSTHNVSVVNLPSHLASLQCPP